MKLFIDFFPIFIFFLVYSFAPELVEATSGFYSPDTLALLQDKPIILATAVLIPATCLQVLYIWLSSHKLEKMHLISLGLVLVLGAATIISQDDTFIKWKPTVLNWLLALVFLGSQFIGQKSLLQHMLGQKLELPNNAWRNLNLLWVGFFFTTGVINLYVAYSFSENTWVNFKMFGMLGLTVVFVILQGIYLARYMNQEPSGSNSDEPKA